MIGRRAKPRVIAWCWFTEPTAEKALTMIREMLGIAEGILQDLHNDHIEIATLIAHIEDNADDSRRRELFSEMKAKLLGHAHAEQEVLYRRLAASQDETSRQIAYEGSNEHQLIEQQLRKMAAAGTESSEEWMAELKVLRELIEHHVSEEESTGFRCARRVLDKKELVAMSGEFQLLKADYIVQVA